MMRRSLLLLSVLMTVGCGASPLAPSAAPPLVVQTSNSVAPQAVYVSCRIKRGDGSFYTVVKGFLFGWMC